MKLYDGIALNILKALNGAANVSDWTNTGGIGAAGSIDFYTATTPFTNITSGGALPAGLLTATQRIMFSSTPVATFTGGTNPTGTRATAVFSFSTPIGTVSTSGNAVCFAVLNTTSSASPVGLNIVFTGSVGTTGSDINFNVTGWQTNDQVSITSLTFVQPEA